MTFHHSSLISLFLQHARVLPQESKRREEPQDAGRAAGEAPESTLGHKSYAGFGRKAEKRSTETERLGNQRLEEKFGQSQIRGETHVRKGLKDRGTGVRRDY